MRPDPPHRYRLYPIMSFAEGRLQVSHKFVRTFLDVKNWPRYQTGTNVYPHFVKSNEEISDPPAAINETSQIKGGLAEQSGDAA